MPIALALATLGVTREQWNGPPDTPRCEELSENLLDSWKNGFAAGERAFNLQSQSYICEGVDCDGDGGFFAKYAWKCAAKGMGGAVMKAEQIVAGLGDKGAPPQPPQQLAPAPRQLPPGP